VTKYGNVGGVWLTATPWYCIKNAFKSMCRTVQGNYWYVQMHRSAVSHVTKCWSSNCTISICCRKVVQPVHYICNKSTTSLSGGVWA